MCDVFLINRNILFIFDISFFWYVLFPFVNDLSVDKAEFVSYVKMYKIVCHENYRGQIYLSLRMSVADGWVVFDEV